MGHTEICVSSCDHLRVACSQMTADDMPYCRRDRRSRKCHADLYHSEFDTMVSMQTDFSINIQFFSEWTTFVTCLIFKTLIVS